MLTVINSLFQNDKFIEKLKYKIKCAAWHEEGSVVDSYYEDTYPDKGVITGSVCDYKVVSDISFKINHADDLKVLLELTFTGIANISYCKYKFIGEPGYIYHMKYLEDVASAVVEVKFPSSISTINIDNLDEVIENLEWDVIEILAYLNENTDLLDLKYQSADYFLKFKNMCIQFFTNLKNGFENSWSLIKIK